MNVEMLVPFVRVIVLDFNGGTVVVDAVRSLSQTEWPSDRFEIVCVDNGSSDGSVEQVEAVFPSVRVLRNGKNLGFPGNNSAMSDLEGVDYVALINSDAFVDSNWLFPLVARAEQSKGIGAVCPKIVFADQFEDLPIHIQCDGPRNSPSALLRGLRVNGVDMFGRAHVFGGGGRSSDHFGIFEGLADGAIVRVPVEAEISSRLAATVELDIDAQTICTVSLAAAVDSVSEFKAGEQKTLSTEMHLEGGDVINNIGSWLDESWRGNDRGLYARDHSEFDDSVDVGLWCGAAVLLGADYLKDVGLFEESFFLYYEDTDLAVRGKERGWRYVTEPGSVVRHLHSASTIEGSAFASHYIERNRLLLLVRHAPALIVLNEFLRFLLVTASYARSAVLQALSTRRLPDLQITRRRAGSLLSAVRMVPRALSARRRLLSRRLLTAVELRDQLWSGASVERSER